MSADVRQEAPADGSLRKFTFEQFNIFGWLRITQSVGVSKFPPYTVF